MGKVRVMKKLLHGSLLGLVLLMLVPAASQAETKVKFVLDWAVIGTHAPFAAALKNKSFEKRGLNVTIDRGYGTVDTINKVANDVYDFGFADPNVLLEYNSKNPDSKVTMVLLLYDGSQSAIVARKASGIKTPKDLEGKKIGAPSGDNTRQMLPVYARIAGFDAGKVEWMSVQPQIKDTMLVRGDVDAVATLEPTTLLAFKKLGANADDFVSFRYEKLMPELLGTGIIVSQRMIREKPDEIRAFVAAVVEGMKSALADPKAAVASLSVLDPLVDVDSELLRFQMGNEMSMANLNLKSSGLGTVTPERLRKSMEYLASGIKVPVPADLKEIYNQDFLPPASDRMF
jgi:NitT/TauT family transport system substrate-binding protein